MGFFSDLFDTVTGGLYGLWDSALNAAGDSLGITQHGRDQYFNRETQREFLERQENFQREMFGRQTDFTKLMYNQQWTDMLSKYPQLQKMLNDQQFNLWKNQFDVQNAWNSPRNQMSLLKAAGVNPAASGVQSSATSSMGASSPTVPPQISPIPFGANASPVGIPQGLSGRGTTMSEVGSFLRDIAQAKKTGKESSRFDEITDAMIEKLYKEADSHMALAAYNGARTIIERALGKEFKQSEIDKNLRMTMYYGQMEQTEKAQEELNKANAWLSNSKNQAILEQLPFIQDNLRQINDYLKSMSYRNRAEAGLAFAKTLTESDLREMYKQQGGLYQELKGLRHVDRVEQYATMPDRITESINRAEQSGLISQRMAEDLRTAQKNNDWYDVREGFDMMYKGMNTYYHGRFTDAKDVQNAIDADWNDFQKEHYGDTNEMYEVEYMDNRGHKARKTYSRRRAPYDN